MDQNVSNYHFEYMDVVQHWHELGGYAGGGHLLTAIHNGWKVENPIEEEQHWCSGMRAVTIYSFTLVKDGRKIKMPVVNNPYINRFIRNRELQVIKKDVKATV